MSWSYETDPEFQSQLDWIADFTRNEIEPMDLVFREPGDPWDPDSPAAKAMEPLRAMVRERGLWACHLGPELGGGGYGQVKLGLMNEILGRSRFGPVTPKFSRTSVPTSKSAGTCSHCLMARSLPATP